MSQTIIYHNPACSTSRKALDALVAAGRAPQVVEYLKTGWTLSQLRALLAAMGLTPRDILRTRGDLAADLGLTDPAAADQAILDAMVAHPVLVERPIVTTAKGTRLCRPADRLQEIL
jgi:arsenate reductase